MSLQNYYSTIYILCMIQNIWWPQNFFFLKIQQLIKKLKPYYYSK
uniref:Uncharacterized protein n=1 Tax=Anguilla anguilla TaxID=7936 RepID=A0A0E9X0K2_ANGAN